MAMITCCDNYVDAAHGEINEHIVQMTAAKTSHNYKTSIRTPRVKYNNEKNSE